MRFVLHRRARTCQRTPSSQRPLTERLPRTGPLLIGILLAASAGVRVDSPRTLHAQQELLRKPIRKITIEGLERTLKAELLVRMRIRLADPYDPEAVSRETGRLYAIGRFKRVQGPFVSEFEDGVEVRFVVEEKPVVQRVRFQGRQALSEGALLSGPPELSTQEGKLFNEFLLDQDVESATPRFADAGLGEMERD